MFNTYFSARYILSKNALVSLVFSDRSDGKTFDCKARALEDYEKDGSQTIYMRRYKSEITEKMYKGFFNEVLDVEKYYRFRLWEFKYSRAGVQVRKNKKDEWDWILFFLPLTMTGKFKSQFSEVLRIKTIDFDEYIPLDGRYIKDELGILLEFWKSIDRDRDMVQIIILGNRVTAFNPCFDYFGIDLEITKDKVRLYKNNTLAVQIYSNREHREAREKGKFKDLIRGTKYEDYDNGGILNALDVKLKNRDNFEYMCSFKTERGEGSIWHKDGQIVISKNKRNDGYVLMDKMYSLKRESYLCNFGNFGKVFKNIYRRGDMFFEDEKCFYIFEKILTKICAL